MLLTLLLSELFNLIGIDLLRRLLDRGWFPLMIAGAAFGGAVGLLRDRDSVIGTLQKVARAILSVLAPVLAAGLVLFVLALPFTGLEPLWSKTKSTTPLLLLCVLASVVLVNATAGNNEEEEARAPLLRWSGMGLIAVMLPLALVAAVSLGKRVGQYGYTPERLWAAVFVFGVAAVALGYLVSLVRGRLAWPSVLRRTNVMLAAGVCILALFLAMPVLNFGSLSASDQLARIAVTDEEVASLAPELSNILGWVEQLQEVDVEGVEPMTAVIPNTLRLREDEVTDGGIRDAVLANAPVAEHGFFAVPKVIE
jgi:aspartyl/glutamyl-tRNA(Asn/Gln) amidotransferase C subunit